MYQCLKCKKIYSDDEVPLIKGCSCGGRFFLYMRDGATKPVLTKEAETELVEKIEHIDKERKSGATPEKISKFGIETIRMKDIGVYEINLEALMRGRPIIVLSKSGSYIISLPSAFGFDETSSSKEIHI